MTPLSGTFQPCGGGGSGGGGGCRETSPSRRTTETWEKEWASESERRSQDQKAETENEGIRE